jgi:hypothetical protein
MASLSPVSADQLLPKAMKSLSISISTNAVQPEPNTITFVVEIVNTSNEATQISTLPGQYPFGIRLLNEKGDDINKHAFHGWSKDRKSKNEEIQFKPNEKKTYHVKLSKVNNSEGEKDNISAGTYDVHVVLPIMNYVDKQYKVDLLKSNSIKIEVK